MFCTWFQQTNLRTSDSLSPPNFLCTFSIEPALEAIHSNVQSYTKKTTCTKKRIQKTMFFKKSAKLTFTHPCYSTVWPVHAVHKSIFLIIVKKVKKKMKIKIGILDFIHMPKIGHFSLGCQVVAKHVKCNFYGFE